VRLEEIFLTEDIVWDAVKKIIRDTTKFRKIGNIKSPAVAGDVLFSKNTPYGFIIIGGKGETIYTGDAALIIDMGGDDKYYGRVGSGIDKISVCIDLSGNDLYCSCAKNFSEVMTHTGRRFYLRDVGTIMELDYLLIKTVMIATRRQTYLKAQEMPTLFQYSLISMEMITIL
jgi:hypothetical protein